MWSFAGDGLFRVLLDSATTPTQKLAEIKRVFQGFGYAAPLVYVLAVAVEVIVAPIPGAMLYAPGGVLFGGFWGGFLSLVGNVIGAAVACQLMRVVRESVRNQISEKQALQDLQARIAENGVMIVFLLRVNPLTSSDLVSYAAGLTRMPVWKLCGGTALGMAPLCWIQAFTADRLLIAFPHLLYPMIVVCGFYTAVVIIVIWRLVNRNSCSVAVERD
jgi:uncharacterized membrane protein YdjX (TVP38/TMEM64 family)